MPRPKSKIKLSTDDVREIASGDISDPTKAKLIIWARSELERRENAGKAGGRPKGSGDHAAD